MVTGCSCHADAAAPQPRGSVRFLFFQCAPPHDHVAAALTTGRTIIGNQYLAVRDQIGTEVLGAGAGCIGTPAQLRDSLRIFQDAGVDQTIFIQQGGKNRHEHICESLELFAAEVMPEFQEKEADREARKLADLAPAIEAAFARKRRLPAPPDAEIPTYQAYGNTVALADADIAKMPEGNRKRALAFRRIAEVAERA